MRAHYLLVALSLIHNVLNSEAILIGRGIADITGLAAEGALYGYAKPDQDARGIHSRIYSRAYVFQEETPRSQRVALVVAEATMISQAVKLGVVEQLQEIYGSGVYGHGNVMLTAIHSHSAPGGYHTFWMFQAPSLGFINETYDIFVAGIVKSIVQATDNLQQGRIYQNSGDLLNANDNRSPYSYYNNPADELASYQYNVEKEMLVLRLANLNEENLGMISFFPVHTTSMKSYNHLVSSDNKGYAAQMFERDYNPGRMPGEVEMIGAFAQTAEGDVTPNLRGNWCDENYVEACTYEKSTCSADPIDPSLCNGYGPAGEHYQDTVIIGGSQYQKAVELFEGATLDQIDGPVEFIHQWVNMSDVIVFQDGEVVNRTCRPAMGVSFAAGATDGPGIRPFTQATTEINETLADIIQRLFNHSDEIALCQEPKPILLPGGELHRPYPWQPEIIPLQLLRIGNLVLAAIPAEITTMSARRLRRAIEEVLIANGLPGNTRAVVVGLSNSYTNYITTFEEYQIQRYEGASTTFGQYTLQGYTMKFSEMARALALGEIIESGPSPPDLRGLQAPALGDVTIDLTPEGMDYGDILNDVNPSYQQGDSAVAVFVAGNPRNNLMTDSTFLEVQRQTSPTEWQTVFVDAHWETRFYWDSDCHDLGTGNTTGTLCRVSQTSNATIAWDIPANQQLGDYRILHRGYAKVPGGVVRPYMGISSVFAVQAAVPGRQLIIYRHPREFESDVIRKELDLDSIETEEDFLLSVFPGSW